MIWGIEFLQEAEKDMKRLDHSVQIQVMKIIVISARTDEQVYKEASKRRKERFHDRRSSDFCRLPFD